MHRIFKLYFIVFVFLVLLSGCREQEETSFQEITLEEPDEKGTSGEVESKDTETKRIFVHICGEVNVPGVYELEAGSRVFEAIEAAGGMTEQASQDYINQAEELLDGQQICVLSKEEAVKVEKETVTNGGKVNINKASKEELMELSGIGETKADAIIRHRKEHGNFKSIEEIMEIEGIKEGVFRKIENQITTS